MRPNLEKGNRPRNIWERSSETELKEVMLAESEKQISLPILQVSFFQKRLKLRELCMQNVS